MSRIDRFPALSVALIVSVFAGTLAAFQGSAAGHAKADLVLRNGQVYTVNPAQPWAEAVAVKDEKIVFVGSNAEADLWVGSDTQTIDLQQQMLLPGFQDAHIHPLEGASLATFMGCDLWELAEADPNPENWVEQIKPCADMPSLHGWILGGGHSNMQLLSLDRHPKDLLDEAFPDRPAAFMEQSSHSMWVNSKALEAVGITDETPNPQGGVIFRDEETGEAIGVLSDSAGDELMHIALKRTPPLQLARYEALLLSQDMMVSYGITSANTARVYWDRGNLQPWLRAEQEKSLKTRTFLSLWTYPHMADEPQLASLKSMYRTAPDSLLKVNRIKFYSDGVPSLNSAAVLQPYGYLVFHDANEMGLNYFTEERMARYIAELEPLGYDVVIHAIGDRGAREALNAIEYAQKANPELGRDRRHFVSHVGWVNEADIPRFKELGVVVDTQINFEPEDAEVEDTEETDSRTSIWDALLANTKSDLDALPELYRNGARIVLSSDWDVASMDPLYTFWRAFDVFYEAMPQEDILPFAIEAYTLNAAYALGQDKQTGSIEVGKLADLAVLNTNILELDPDEVKDAYVTLTLVGGQEVYRAGDACGLKALRTEAKPCHG
ncbi:MAG: amidohydrolase [Pseudomonadota bacterium]